MAELIEEDGAAVVGVDAAELGVGFRATSGPVIARAGALTSVPCNPFAPISLMRKDDISLEKFQAATGVAPAWASGDSAAS